MKTRITSLAGNKMKLDGGSMFGNAPKALWSRWLSCDDHNRIDIASRSLLIETENEKILFETGVGHYLDPSMQKRFGIEEDRHVLLDSLEDIGVEPAEITRVVLSHLHFDHAGGLLEKRDGSDGEFGLAFPSAEYIAGEKNFDRAVSPHSRDRASFIPELNRLLEQSGRLSLKKHGDRIETDGVGVTFTESSGHTPGMLVSDISAGDHKFIFTGDLIPAHFYVNLPITMGFDRNPELLIDEKQALLDRAFTENAYLVFPHDPFYAVSELDWNEDKKRYQPENPAESFSIAF
ncbi:MAG: MBL fold metallo-hydrolase [Desulfarculaceae bacterium]|nr:MBL fold metallo-hydrolase [Desulfarculaceae bacterium]